MTSPVLRLSNGVLILRYGETTAPVNYSLRDPNKTSEKVKQLLKEWGADNPAIAQAMSDLTKLYETPPATKTVIPSHDRDLSIEPITCTGEDGIIVEIRADDGLMVSPAALYYKTPDTILIGELILAHAIVKEPPKKDGQDPTVKDTIEPVLVYSINKEGAIERIMKPMRFIPSIKIDERLVSIEKFGRLNAAIPSLMSLEAARRYLRGDGCKNITELYNEIVMNIKRFVCFSWDERLFTLCACWILATYFFDIFSAFPQLFFFGSQGSGKTRAGLTITYQCRHGYLVTDPTESTLFRMSQALKPTLLIDESLIGPAAWKIARSAFKRGFSVPRINRTEKDGFLMELFSLYMPIVTTSTETQQQLGGQEADEARNIRVNMQTGKDPIGRDPELQDFSEIRDDLYHFRLLVVDDVVK